MSFSFLWYRDENFGYQQALVKSLMHISQSECTVLVLTAHWFTLYTVYSHRMSTNPTKQISVRFPVDFQDRLQFNKIPVVFLQGDGPCTCWSYLPDAVCLALLNFSINRHGR